jgi:hypothetical protein
MRRGDTSNDPRPDLLKERNSRMPLRELEGEAQRRRQKDRVSDFGRDGVHNSINVPVGGGTAIDR